RPSPVALLLWINLLGLEEWYDWGTLAIVFSCWCCISSLMWIHCLIKRLQDNVSVRKTEDTLLYMGRNTLPIYLFHPIFTMAAKFYHPLFNWDRSEICFALVTIFIAIAGSIGIAKMMEKTRLAYLFGKGKMLR
ncbi:MAG: acyltransferase family protein, partial [Segatella copri]